VWSAELDIVNTGGEAVHFRGLEWTFSLRLLSLVA
jgi:hypothetical protein